MVVEGWLSILINFYNKKISFINGWYLYKFLYSLIKKTIQAWQLRYFIRGSNQKTYEEKYKNKQEPLETKLFYNVWTH